MSFEQETDNRINNDIIFSGSFSYCSKKSHYYAAHGYSIVRMKEWADGKHTFVMRKNENLETN